MKGLFLYNPADLRAEIPGGVQICSQEFLKIIQETVDELSFFEVRYTRSLIFRICYKFNLDNYQGYNTDLYIDTLKETILKKKITHVFINKSELIRFAKAIKKYNIPNPPRVIIMSHGNESGDLLGDIAREHPRYRGFLKFTSILKLGLTLYTESRYRRQFVDLVCTMSEEENSIERWLGINKTFFIPRVINQQPGKHRSPIKGRLGYVGTLSHSPNLSAIKQLCEALIKKELSPEIRIVGQPVSIGRELEKEYVFIRYLGPLTESELTEEIKSWSFFINPIFNYSRGASMKLAKAIEWELPVITTQAGRRGYLWKKGNLIETENNPESFIEAIERYTSEDTNYTDLVEGIITIKENSFSKVELALQMRQILDQIQSGHQ